jgi:putative aminopeptidase FrvX
MKLHEITAQLCCAAGPSGFEDTVRARISELLTPYVDEIRTDTLGNLIAVRRSGKPCAHRLLLDAHMDEIGFIITGIENGFLRFATLGGVDPRMLPAREVRLLTMPEPIFGVIDTMPPHVLSAEDMDKALTLDKLYIDVGLSQEAAEKQIPLGTPAVFASGCELLGDNMLSGKSLDDRACVAIIIKTMEQLHGKALDMDIYCLISTQEEVGLRGAKTGAFAIDPDCAIAIDVTHARTPDAKKEETLPIGKGAAIAVGPNMNRNVTNALINTAQACEIPYQIEVVPGNSGTNGWAIQVSRAGVSTALISLPIRYMHSPVETMDLTDAASIVRLLTEFILQGEEAL